MLCNDKAVLGPWVNTRKTNAFTGGVIAVLITLSVVLTASVMFPAITAGQIFTIMGGCAVLAVAVGGFAVVRERRAVRGQRAAAIEAAIAEEVDAATGTALGPVDRLSWRMPPLSELSAPAITGARRIGLIGLRAYLAVAMVMVIVKIVMLAIGH
jgi:hypothetical protein